MRVTSSEKLRWRRSVSLLPLTDACPSTSCSATHGRRYHKHWLIQFRLPILTAYETALRSLREPENRFTEVFASSIDLFALVYTQLIHLATHLVRLSFYLRHLPYTFTNPRAEEHSKPTAFLGLQGTNKPPALTRTAVTYPTSNRGLFNSRCYLREAPPPRWRSARASGVGPRSGANRYRSQDRDRKRVCCCMSYQNDQDQQSRSSALSDGK